MCLIAQRAIDGAHIPNAVVDYNFNINPDGFGLAWRDPKDGVLFEKFAPSSKAAFRDLLKQIDQTGMHYVAHWRKATHGPACLDLSHPFDYTDKDGVPMLAFHNGVIDIKTAKDESDTLAFVNGVLRYLEHGWWENPAMMFLVEQSIGWSRLLLMTPEQDVIVNADSWKKEGGLYYSTYPGPVSRPNVQSGGGNSSLVAVNGVPTGTGSAIGTTTSGTKVFTPTSTGGNDDADYERWLREAAKDAGLKPVDTRLFVDKGHEIEPTSQIDSTISEDKYGSAVCSVCKTEGEYFVIDGNIIFDIEHKSNDDENASAEDGACLLPTP
jgi:hypothetical protein